MTKSEIKKAKDNDLITEYVKSYSSFILNCNFDRGTKQLGQHCQDLEDELLRRGILTNENIDALRL